MYASLAEIAAAEKLSPSYVSRIARLTLLAPDIVEAILDGTQGPEVALVRVLQSFSLEWAAQRSLTF